MSHSPATELVQYYDELVNYISRVFGNRQLANEIVQETYLRVLQKPEKFSELENPIAFLKIASCNIGRDYLRKNQLEISYVEQEIIAHEVFSEFNSLFTQQELVVAKKQYSQIILQKIQRLPPTCQDVFLLIQFYGMSQVEVAEQLGISRMMVIKHLTRALQSFLPVFIDIKDE